MHFLRERLDENGCGFGSANCSHFAVGITVLTSDKRALCDTNAVRKDRGMEGKCGAETLGSRAGKSHGAGADGG